MIFSADLPKTLAGLMRRPGVNIVPQASCVRAILAGHLFLHPGPLKGHNFGPGGSLQLRET